MTKINDIQVVSESHTVCVYPTTQYIQHKRDLSAFTNQPYTKQLALGEPQLKPIYFKIEVLERYFRDPRYNFSFTDYSGRITNVYDKANISLVDPEDEIFLKTFGLAINKEGDRAAIVYLRYLRNLTSDHQMFWKSKDLNDGYRMLEEYYINTIGGNWTNSYSVFSAFVEEQKALNDISSAIFETSLFRHTFEKDNRPREFTFFFVPTLRNYHDFISLLDKMISDNINKAFFEKNIELYDLIDIGQGQFERKNKGTLRLLEEWLTNSYYQNEESSLAKELLKPFSDIRKERQNPAHKINVDVYDKSLSIKQAEVIIAAYNVMRTLRIIFQQHPLGKSIQIPTWLDNGEIKAY